jgi:hypothetical protein
LRRLGWFRILVLVGWVVIIPPIKPDTQGLYIGADGRPANVAPSDPFFQWTVYGRYQSGAECNKTRSELEQRALDLNPASASAVAWSFAKCLEDNDSLLQPEHGPLEHLPNGPPSQSIKAAPK